MNHLAYEIDDVEALRARMAAAGFRDTTVPNKHPFRKRVYFYDSEGNDWEFVQYLSDDPAMRNDYQLSHHPPRSTSPKCLPVCHQSMTNLLLPDDTCAYG